MREKGFVYEELYWEVDELQRVTQEIAESSTRGSSVVEPSAETTTKARATDTQPAAVAAPDDVGAEPASAVTITSEPGPLSSRMIKTRLWRPMATGVTSLSAHEPFMIYVKAAVITGAILASPWIFLQIWAFVAAGLYPHEKNYVYFFLPVSLGLFFAGAALAFFFVFDPVLDFLFTFNRMMNIDPDPRISEWMSFVLFLPLGFGISFQLPLVMMIVERIGVVSVNAYIEKWRLAVLGIFVLSMFLTPADPISMMLMAIPLTILYFGGVALCLYMPRRTSPYGEGYDPA
jgi:sec-independent protein translocase protein TatC